MRSARSAFDKGHELKAIRFTDFVDRHDVRVVELAADSASAGTMASVPAEQPAIILRATFG